MSFKNIINQCGISYNPEYEFLSKEDLINLIKRELLNKINVGEFKPGVDFIKELNSLICGLSGEEIKHDTADSVFLLLSFVKESFFSGDNEKFHQYMDVIKSQKIKINYHNHELNWYEYIPYFEIENYRINKVNIIKWIKDSIVILLKNKTYIDYAKCGYTPDKYSVSGMIGIDRREIVNFKKGEGFVFHGVNKKDVVSCSFIDYSLTCLESEEMITEELRQCFKALIKPYYDFSIYINSSDKKILTYFNDKHQLIDKSSLEEIFNFVEMLAKKKGFKS
ncbi:hypothetical protein SS41_23150 [Enterobacter hormaechei subsp. xiangfangensis]|uniref:hypothetical protein n=1 Tax=Enterobacter hormaechei TaxID=158836 RepID=UPI0005EDB4D2|nr:hypothetical protein [Enterobacter hormaechei]KJN19154.1 hypothetical protein SS41_23150 [Enterobacter hormaechei subsp. xiangfangensis]